MKNIDSNLVESFCNEFKSNFLSLKSLIKTQYKTDLRFHLFGYWNVLKIKNNKIYHYKLNGGNNKTEELFSEISFNEIQKTVFIRYKNSFILFKKHKSSIKPIFINTELRTLEKITSKHIFLNNQGVEVIRNYWVLDNNLNLTWKKKNAFTDKEII